MNGSRLFIHSANPQHAAAWTRALSSRMRERKLFDRYPGTKIVAMPTGTLQDVPSHEDRIYLRDQLWRGSIIKELDGDPNALYACPDYPDCADHFHKRTGAGRRQDLYDEIIDEWIEQQDRATLVATCGGWGSPYPKVVFIAPCSDKFPFGDKSPASRTLTEILNHARLWEKDIHFLEIDVTPAELLVLHPYEVVALGSIAAMALEEIGQRSYVRFPHPQHLIKYLPETWGLKLRGLLEDKVIF